MTIIDEYLDYHIQYAKEYGDNTCVLMQIGHFFEAYAVDNAKEQINSDNIYRLSDIMNIQLTRKNKTIQENHRGNPLMIGVNMLSVDKYIHIWSTCCAWARHRPPLETTTFKLRDI